VPNSIDGYSATYVSARLVFRESSLSARRGHRVALALFCHAAMPGLSGWSMSVAAPRLILSMHTGFACEL
jgi:hypothetical protein